MLGDIVGTGNLKTGYLGVIPIRDSNEKRNVQALVLALR